MDALFGNIQIFDDQGSLLLFFGESSKMNPGGFSLPNGIFIDDANKIYVADTYHGSVQVFQYLSVGG
ncbi:NHL repeat protein [bacterium BMS3Bbin04]|nr:NHL repeat protein [bacterium BMS3Bbin04]